MNTAYQCAKNEVVSAVGTKYLHSTLRKENSKHMSVC